MADEPTPARSCGRILVADDEPHIRRILVTLLEHAAFTVDEAEDGHRALELLRTRGYAFVLLDLLMPGPSGLDVLRFMRASEAHRATPAIVLTAKGQDSDRAAALSSGAADFLTKPFSPKRLLARIREILDEV